MEVLYHITGILSLIIFIIGIHFKSNDKLKKYMVANSLIKSINMFLNMQYVGMFVNLINFARNIFSIRFENTEKLKHVMAMIIFSL
ncbi:MAG: YgjV family protein, partial [Deltaproteobacteria bacterium]|nr:YgjV family protein [Deltaproteobacteria bacterium]